MTRVRALKRERRALLRGVDDPAIAQVRQLHRLRAIGIDGAWLYVMEFFSWRQFRNRRQVGGLAGLTDAHYQSGDVGRERPVVAAGLERELGTDCQKGSAPVKRFSIRLWRIHKVRVLVRRSADDTDRRWLMSDSRSLRETKRPVTTNCSIDCPTARAV